MPDNLSPEQRRRNMRASSRQKNTAPEMALRRALTARGVKGYRLHRSDIPGCPDLAWIGARVVIFVDGAFWHGHKSKYRPGRSESWDAKITRNVKRDRQVNAVLQDAGWTVVRLWDFEVAADPDGCVDRVKIALGR